MNKLKLCENHMDVYTRWGQIYHMKSIIHSYNKKPNKYLTQFPLFHYLFM